MAQSPFICENLRHLRTAFTWSPLRSFRFAASGPQVNHKRPEPREPKSGIDVVFNHVECKVVKPAETPDANSQQHADPPRRVFEEEQDGRQNSDDKEQQAFEFDPARVGEVFHQSAMLRRISPPVTNSPDWRNRTPPATKRHEKSQNFLCLLVVPLCGLSELHRNQSGG